jgi:hypothetical protein
VNRNMALTPYWFISSVFGGSSIETMMPPFFRTLKDLVQFHQRHILTSIV